LRKEIKGPAGAQAPRREPFAITPREAHTDRVALRGRNQKAPPVPVDPAPLARVAGPIPHFRKLAFVFGATATVLALVLIQQLTGFTT
jgi:hypothetical protein